MCVMTHRASWNPYAEFNRKTPGKQIQNIVTGKQAEKRNTEKEVSEANSSRKQKAKKQMKTGQ